MLELLEDPDPGTRASSIDTLGYYAVHSEPARLRLLEIAANGTRWDRELAAGAIAKNLGDEKLLPADLSGWAKVRVLEAGPSREKYADPPGGIAGLKFTEPVLTSVNEKLSPPPGAVEAIAVVLPRPS